MEEHCTMKNDNSITTSTANSYTLYVQVVNDTYIKDVCIHGLLYDYHAKLQ